jgi:hypothetical protein
MDAEKLLVAAMITGVMILLGKIVIPITQAYARRLDPSARATQPTGELADLEARVRDLEAREARVAELEERLDFTERMLAQQREQPRLGAGEQR